MKAHSNISQSPRRSGDARGFSLIEVLVIVVVVAVLTSLALPSLRSLSPTRKAALNELRSFVDSAPVLARKENRDVYLAFADNSSGVESLAYRGYALFRAVDPRLAPGESLLTRELVQVTPWETLPVGMVFALGEEFEVASLGRMRTILDLSDSVYERLFPTVENDQRVTRAFPFLMWSAAGRVEVPPLADADALHIGIAEGHFTETEGRVLINRSGTEIAQAELLGINYYTGKSRVLTD